MDELVEGTAEKLKGEEAKAKVFAHPLPFNLIPHIDSFQVPRLEVNFAAVDLSVPL